MKRHLILIAFVLLTSIGSFTQAQQQQRVARIYYAGSIIFQTPVHSMDSIKYSNDNLLTFYYSDATWSRSVDMIDSLTFAMSSEGDTTIITDTVPLDTAGMITIAWNGSTVSVTNPHPTDSIKITTDGGHVTVKSNCTSCQNIVYNLTGSSNDGNLLFSKLNTPIILRLNNVQLTSVGAAAINIDKNQNAVIHLEKGTTNTFTDADSNADKAVIYGKGIFTVQGSGALNITSSYANGLQGKRGVTINQGTTMVTVTADTKKGIKTDQHFYMNGGNLTVVASGSIEIDTSETYATGYDFSYCTGIKTGDADESTVGNIVVNGGNLTVTCPSTNHGGRCLSSDYDIIFTGGYTVLTTAGDGSCVGGTGRNAVDGYACTCVSADSNIIFNGGRLDARSTGLGGRGIKADGKLIVGSIGGDDEQIYIYLQTSGNAINPVSSGGGPWGGGSNDDYFKGLPKCIKIEGNIYFNSGHVGAYCSQTSGDPNGEAIESKDSLFVNGGIIEANAFDDALNAANYLEINGGKLWCYSRGNDAIDCNGNTNIHGGLIIAKGREVGFDAATDAGGHFFIDGGTLICQGGNMGAWDAPNVSGYQKYLQINNLGTTGLCVKNSANDVILMYLNTTPSGSGFTEDYSDPGAKPPPPPGGNNTLVFCSPDVVSGSYQYWTTTTFSGGSSWHGYYIGSIPTTSGSSSTTTAR